MKEEGMFNLSMLLLRCVLGAVYVMHGAQKMFGMFGGIGVEGTKRLMESLGLTAALPAAIAWGCIELAGGIFLIFGILSRWAASFLLLTIAWWTWSIGATYGFSPQNPGIEYNILAMGSCLPLILMGGGSWSVWDT